MILSNRNNYMKTDLARPRLADRVRQLLGAVGQETRKIRTSIYESRTSAMVKQIFEAIEAMFRAVIYLLILLMGLAIAALGAYTILFLALRIGQLLHTLIFQKKWL